jgi:hypothetical protein
MKKIKFVRRGTGIDRADIRKAQKARARQLKMAVHFAMTALENPQLKAHYETLAKERNFPDAHRAAVSIFLSTEASMRSSLRRIKDN